MGLAVYRHIRRVVMAAEGYTNRQTQPHRLQQIRISWQKPESMVRLAGGQLTRHLIERCAIFEQLIGDLSDEGLSETDRFQ